jgi:hypothetical protein
MHSRQVHITDDCFLSEAHVEHIHSKSGLDYSQVEKRQCALPCGYYKRQLMENRLTLQKSDRRLVAEKRHFE